VIEDAFAPSGRPMKLIESLNIQKHCVPVTLQKYRRQDYQSVG